MTTTAHQAAGKPGGNRQHEGPISAPLQLACGSRSEIGRRSTNDDHVLTDPARGVYVICDGAKGTCGGRTAAELAGEVIARRLPELEGELGQAIGPRTERVVEQLATEAHSRILDAQATNADLKGITTTLALVVHRGDQLLVSHVGDSRIYRSREGRLEQLSRDHNVENYLQDHPELRSKVRIPGKTLVRALGLASSSQFKVDHRRVDLRRGDLILICTDGLTDSVPTLTLQAILGSAATDPPGAVADRLVRAALSHGSMDNISATVLEPTETPHSDARTAILAEARLTGSAGPRSLLGWIVCPEGPLAGRVRSLQAGAVIGADPGCDLVLPGALVAPRHAEVFRARHGFAVRDLGSTSGTLVNGVRISETSLVDGDVIRLGPLELIFKQHAAGAREVR